MSRGHASAISRRLKIDGHQRHEPGVAGYAVVSDSWGTVAVWQMNPHGYPVPPDLVLKGYGRTLVDAGYVVSVAGDTHLVVRVR